MPFDPLKWLTLANELAARDDEASRRTAIGRYYYAVFLKSRISLAYDGKLTPTGHGTDHSAVARELKKRRASAGTALEGLARLREKADYEPGAAVLPDSVTKANAHAAEVVRMCQSDWGRLPQDMP